MSQLDLMVKKRIAYLCLGVMAAIALLICRLAYIQFIQSNHLQKMALEQRMRPVPVEAKRGIIYDRNNKILAVSINVDSVYAVPSEIKDAEAASIKLAAILDLNSKDIYAKLKEKQSFVWVKRKIDAKQAAQIKKAKITGIGMTQEGRRFYPKANLASHILGFAGIDSQGLNGLEWSYDKYLKGSQGSVIAERDGLGREIPEGMEKFLPAKDGNNLILTIDEVIQHIAERELERAVVVNRAKSATVIIMEPKTGEILALANKPDYNPNEFWKYSQELWRNDAVFYNYEPGSTFKIITSSAAVEENMVKPDDNFYCSGGITVGGHYVKCHKHEGHGAEDFRDVVKNSCNPGFIQVGLKLGKEKFGSYIRKFGFGQLTGVEIQGESKGIVKDIADVQTIDVATNSIGQGIAVTPIQLVTAVSAVANGGTLMKPLIVKRIEETDGKIVKEFSPISVRRVITQETAAIVGELLEGVVSPNGGGKNAFLEGYRLAGKTGTAQKAAATGGYAENKYVASFVGYGPVENPRFVILVLINEPSTGNYYGGQIAAPVFREIARDVLRYMEIPPSVAETKLPDSKKSEVTVPDLTNMMAADVEKKLQEVNLNLRMVGDGPVALDQTPKPGAKVAENTLVIAYFKTDKTGRQEITVPYLRGKSMREAAVILGKMGLKMKPTGSGVAASQSPAAGAKVRRGTTVIINFAKSNNM